MAAGFKRWPAGLALLLGLVALSACQTTSQTISKTPAVSNTPAPAARAAPATPPANKAVTAEPPPQIVARPPQPQPAPEPKIDDDPNQLMGLDRSALTALLGKPDLVRREKPAEIWQYLGSDCIFDVVLYDSGQRYRVTYLEARNAAADRLAPRPCLNQLLRARLDQPLS